jgi:hypothetical protein
MDTALLVHAVRLRAIDRRRQLPRGGQPRRDVLHFANYIDGKVVLHHIDGLVDDEGNWPRDGDVGRSLTSVFQRLRVLGAELADRAGVSVAMKKRERRRAVVATCRTLTAGTSSDPLRPGSAVPRERARRSRRRRAPPGARLVHSGQIGQPPLDVELRLYDSKTALVTCEHRPGARRGACSNTLPVTYFQGRLRAATPSSAASIPSPCVIGVDPVP